MLQRRLETPVCVIRQTTQMLSSVFVAVAGSGLDECYYLLCCRFRCNVYNIPKTVQERSNMSDGLAERIGDIIVVRHLGWQKYINYIVIFYTIKYDYTNDMKYEIFISVDYTEPHGLFFQNVSVIKLLLSSVGETFF